MSSTKNVVGWFEIPVANMERAIKFYETVFDYKLSRNQMGPLDMAWFPWQENPDAAGCAGSLVYHEDFYKPSDNGTLVYFISPSGDLQNELSKINDAGGKVFVEKTQISPTHGYMAVFYDTEGNRVALHSLK